MSDMATRIGNRIAAWFHVRRVRARRERIAEVRTLWPHIVAVLPDHAIERAIYGDVITWEDGE